MIKIKTKYLTLALIIGLVLIIGSFAVFAVVQSFSIKAEFSDEDSTLVNTTVSGNDLRLLFNPTRVGSVVSTGAGDLGYLNSATGIHVVGNYAYVTTTINDSFNVIDISDPSNPTIVSSLVDTGTSPEGYFNGLVKGFTLDNFSYVAATNNDSFSVINVTNVSNISRVSTLVDSGYLDALYDVYAEGNFAYVVSALNSSFSVINITNVSNLSIVSTFQDSARLDNAGRFYISGNFSYVTSAVNNSFNIINITDKTNLTRVASITDSTWLEYSWGVYVDGDYAYVTAVTNKSLNIIDISDKTNPTRVGSISSPRFDGAWGIVVNGNYAYMTSQNNHTLSIINITNKTNPSLIGLKVDGNFPGDSTGYLSLVRGIQVVGNYAYVVAQTNDSMSIYKINETFPSGYFESQVIDGEETRIWNRLDWNDTEPTGTNISIEFKSCNDSLCSGESYETPKDTSPVTSLGVNNNRYAQFKVTFETTNLSLSPLLDSINVTYSSPTSTSTVSQQTGNGAASTLKKHTWTKITPGKAVIKKDFNLDAGIKEIQIEVNNEAQNVKITVTKYDGKPSQVSKEKTGKVYRYLQIETENLKENLKKATLKIQVEKSWIKENEIEKENIALFKFDNLTEEWNELTTTPTTLSDGDETYYYYSVELTSFSFFAIGEKAIVVEEEEEDIGTIVGDLVSGNGERNLTWLWISIGTILLVGAYIVFRKRKW